MTLYLSPRTAWSHTPATHTRSITTDTQRDDSRCASVRRVRARGCSTSMMKAVTKVAAKETAMLSKLHEWQTLAAKLSLFRVLSSSTEASPRAQPMVIADIDGTMRSECQAVRRSIRSSTITSVPRVSSRPKANT